MFLWLKNIQGKMDFRFKVRIFWVKSLLPSDPHYYVCDGRTSPSSLYNVRWYIDLSNYSSCLVFFFLTICSCLWWRFCLVISINMWSLNTIVQNTSNPSPIPITLEDWWGFFRIAKYVVRVARAHKGRIITRRTLNSH